MFSLDNLTIPRKLLLTLGLMLATIIGVDAMIYLKAGEIRSSTQWNEHTYQVIETINATMAAMVDQEATVKRFTTEGGAIVLKPEHPTMKPIVVDPHRAEFRILGKVIGLIREM